MSSEALTRFVLEIERTQAQLAADSDRLLAELGLTTARWRVLQALNAAGKPRTVAQLARDLGVARQGVQRLADELAASGHIGYVPNPDHARAKLAEMTERGRNAAAEALQRKAFQAEALAQGLSPEWLEIGTELARLVARRSAKAAIPR
ncbi:MAG: MarR family winged helix-turn-helix transcriptional regulator [Phenylobacterium sp.]|uniref:MarR family winged helix-turn-helix transcriptional regulator n=1 Tax=Phenylobacterium sp. TaxID=1871053 RepID=UPI0039198A41